LAHDVTNLYLEIRQRHATLMRMKGDVVFRVYGVHAGREKDVHFGTFRTESEARASIAKLN